MGDDDKLDPRAFDPVDRSPPTFMREYPGTWKLTLRERIKGAWRGMVNGWRGGE